MSPRAIRRAAERQSLKRAVELTKVMTASVGADHPPDTFVFADLIDDIKQTSEARIIANRANAQLSTGPCTEEGKAKSSLNAVKTGLTGRTVLLPSDDALIYQQHLDRHFAEFSPATDKEKAFVQIIADTEWRLLRIAPLEAGIYAVGCRKLAGQFAEEKDPTNRAALITAEVYLTYRKDLSNLALQERRLRNQCKADVAALKQLQQERAGQEKAVAQKRKEEVERAFEIKQKHDKQRVVFVSEDHGFDFSLKEMRAYNAKNDLHYSLTGAELNFDRFLTSYRSQQKEPQAA
jgi:hypothetical protein